MVRVRCQLASTLGFFPTPLISTRGVLEGFVAFCFQQNLGSKTADGYIDGLKYYASRLDGVPVIPGQLVIDKLLNGFIKLGKRPGPKKLELILI